MLCCGYQKAHSTKYSLSETFQSCQSELDKYSYTWIKFMDLFRAYDCLQYSLFNAKFVAYNVNCKDVPSILNHLPNCRQRTKIYTA